MTMMILVIMMKMMMMEVVLMMMTVMSDDVGDKEEECRREMSSTACSVLWQIVLDIFDIQPRGADLPPPSLIKEKNVFFNQLYHAN